MKVVTDRQSGPQSASQPVIQTNCQEQQHFLEFFSCSAVPEAITLVSNGSDTILLLSLDFDQLGRISAINSPGGEFWCVLWTTVSQTINKLKPSPVGKDRNYESVITLLKGQTLTRLQ